MGAWVAPARNPDIPATPYASADATSNGAIWLNTSPKAQPIEAPANRDGPYTPPDPPAARVTDVRTIFPRHKAMAKGILKESGFFPRHKAMAKGILKESG